MSYHRQPSDAYFKSVRTCIGDINVHENFRSVYKGFWLSNLIGFAHFNMFLETTKFVNVLMESFAEKNKENSENSNSINVLKDFSVGPWISSVVLTGLLHPLDTVR